ncbi:glycosyltransferase family 2 protein [Pedobacter roseus]|uniref:Glycosyltransferase family 2 protein n=1 Tax=Pedobacter roseus TaxID=336820 RepID=A0A7G9QI59_9SPHI|nr:glycosyltransferase family 2 protein [Pedobacter roseus]QNN43034.1 glycosyltransferase family 2 protein [Pedobacter roseus]
MKTVSVIIPTYNRDFFIKLTLESFVTQNYPNMLEIIVIDNNSTDNTLAVVKELCEKYPIIKYFEEPRQGVHYARNSAIKYAKGEVLYYTDDDMIAEPDLLTNLVPTFELNDKIAVVSGRVLPKWDIHPPDWILKYCLNAHLSLNLDETPLIISDQMINIFSCHEAILKEAIINAGGFNPENTKGEWIGDGETGLSIKILDLGYLQAYNGLSVINHIIPKSRMTQSYLNKRFANQANCDSFTIYRAANGLNNSKLFTNILNNFIAVLYKSLATPWHFIRAKDNWRITMAQAFYHSNRIAYDIKLMTRHHMRDLVLRDNWIEQTN